jgi:hypothetical protein
MPTSNCYFIRYVMSGMGNAWTMTKTKAGLNLMKLIGGYLGA